MFYKYLNNNFRVKNNEKKKPDFVYDKIQLKLCSKMLYMKTKKRKWIFLRISYSNRNEKIYIDKHNDWIIFNWLITCKER